MAGEKGFKGFKGDQGEKGGIGLKGFQGDKGFFGAKGNVGIRGAKGKENHGRARDASFFYGVVTDWYFRILCSRTAWLFIVLVEEEARPPEDTRKNIRAASFLCVENKWDYLPHCHEACEAATHIISNLSTVLRFDLSLPIMLGSELGAQGPGMCWSDYHLGNKSEV